MGMLHGLLMVVSLLMRVTTNTSIIMFALIDTVFPFIIDPNGN
jgi:hypothetical protein